MRADRASYRRRESQLDEPVLTKPADPRLVMVWAVVFGSKFLVLEAVALVFGSRVSLGGFFSVTLLILTLLLSRAAVRRLLESSGSGA